MPASIPNIILEYQEALLKKRYLQEICQLSVDVADDGMPDWANLVSSPILAGSSSNKDMGGGGIYACFWDDKLIYIGSFVGPEDAPFGGNVTDRIYKHVTGLTLRSKNLGFGKRPLRSIIDNLDHSIADDLRKQRQASDRLEAGSNKATYNKARFAKQHWQELCGASPDELFKRFSFVYRRLDPVSEPVPKRVVKESWIKPIEKSLVQQFEPICNTEFRVGEDGAPASFDQVTEAFELAFAKPLLKLSATALPTLIVPTQKY